MSRKPIYPTRRLRLQHFLCVALFVQIPCQLPTGSVCRAEDTVDPYDVLYDVIMVRKDSDGRAYGTNEVGPLIYGRSKYPFDDVTFPKLTAALERFNALPQTRIEAYGAMKRALLQRHLWVVFDATIPNDYKPPTHLDRRGATQKILATLIGRVALTEAEIIALPDTRKATIKSGGFPQEHDPTNRFKPFLPADLYAEESSWVCLGKAGNPDSDHAMIDRWRSTFLQFVRLPDGREATLEYIKTLNDREAFPIGTQFALIDQAFLISDEGELVLSPFINSIQLRAYLNVTTTDLEARPRATVCVTEFAMQPGQLIEGKFAMRALGPTDFRFQTIAADSGGLVDPLEARSATEAQKLTPNLQGCVFCHERSRSGVRSLGDFMFGDRYADKLRFEAGHPVRIAQSVAAAKRKDATWKQLQELWPGEGPSDRYDTLYDVIMTRYGPDGKAFGADADGVKLQCRLHADTTHDAVIAHDRRGTPLSICLSMTRFVLRHQSQDRTRVIDLL